MPFLMEWPAQIFANRISNDLITIEDLPTTFEALITNNQPRAARDGVSIMPLITSPAKPFQRPNPHVVCAYVNPTSVSKGVLCPSLAVIEPTGTWKLIVQRANSQSWSPSTPFHVLGLYNISEGEWTNMARFQPHVVHSMKVMAKTWISSAFQDFGANCKGYYGPGAPLRGGGIVEPKGPIWTEAPNSGPEYEE